MMDLKKPLFWNLKKPNFISYLLIPFTIPIILNNFILKIKKKIKFTNIKSICVGNIYLGGTGKTPLTIRLYQILSKIGLKVVTAKKFHSNQFDEQTLLKENTRTIIAKDRLDAYNQAIDSSNDIIIFDDGLQEKNVDYDLKFVCFKNKNWIGNGMLIPSGPLRENVDSLKRYDVVFLNGTDENTENINETILKINPKIKIFNSYYEIKNLNTLDLKSDYLIFSGIGDPSSFKEILLKNNIKVKKEIIFPDHHNYKKNDIKKIFELAEKINTKILTTQKDVVKISNISEKKINFLKIELKIIEEQKLIDFLNEKFN